MSKLRKDTHNSDVPVICRSCEARHKGICDSLDVSQLRALSKNASRKNVSAGTEFNRDSEPITNYANILSGVVKLSKLLKDGRQQIVGLQFAPDLLGRPFAEESKFAAEAATDVVLCSFPKSALERLMRVSPGLQHKILLQSLKELDEARDWMVTLGRKSATEKIAQFLYKIAAHVDPETDFEGAEQIEFDLPLTRSDIADFLGLTIETVSRQLTKLRQAGVIAIKYNRHVVVLNPKRLKQMADD